MFVRFPQHTGLGASHEHLPLVISKIECVEALVNFDAILAESDGIMVARGDLAVEIPMETLANVQKEIVRRCNAAGIQHNHHRLFPLPILTSALPLQASP